MHLRDTQVLWEFPRECYILRRSILGGCALGLHGVKRFCYGITMAATDSTASHRQALKESRVGD